jgi:hypothetical protein
MVISNDLPTCSEKEGWTMSADASVFQAEAKRRLKLFRANDYQVGGPGNRIKILCEDEGDKTADLESTAIMAKAGDQIIMSMNNKIMA